MSAIYDFAGRNLRAGVIIILALQLAGADFTKKWQADYSKFEGSLFVGQRRFGKQSSFYLDRLPDNMHLWQRLSDESRSDQQMTHEDIQ